MSKKYTVAYFIKKFLAIPARLWTTGEYHNKVTGRRCAMGHCGTREAGFRTGEGKALRNLFSRRVGRNVTHINDYRTSRFPQKTPRGRILAALRYIKAKSC